MSIARFGEIHKKKKKKGKGGGGGEKGSLMTSGAEICHKNQQKLDLSGERKEGERDR